jgi:putative DNA primase/helicase
MPLTIHHCWIRKLATEEYCHLIIEIRSYEMICSNNTISSSNTVVFASAYIDRGWSVTPVQFQTKQAILKNWPKHVISIDTLEGYFGSRPTNIGIVLGEASNGVVDVDLDNPTALKLADDFLPHTDCVFGRASKPRSHRIYQTHSPKRIVEFAANGKMIAELRGDRHMTVFPGSVHPSGEPIVFENGSGGDPKLVKWEELEHALCKLSIATLLLDSWKPGIRHQIALATSGLLRQLGYTKDDAQKIIRAIAKRARDEQIFDRLECVKTTYAKQGQPVSGKRELANLIGDAAVTAIEKWSRSTNDQPKEQLGSNHSPTDITSDAGAADSFADARSGELIFRDDNDTWFRRIGYVFRPISYVQVQGDAKGFMQEQVNSTNFLGSSRSLLSKGKIDNLLTLSRHHFRVDAGSLDECRHLVGCSDGTVIDLDKQTVTAEVDSTVTKAVRCRYDPDAACPHFEKFLNEIFAGNKSVISFIQRAVGYTLSGYVTERCLFILVGNGSNGKSTLLNTLQFLLGDYAASTPAQTLMVSRHGNEQTNDLAKLVGVRCVIAAETEKSHRLAEAKIKRITGGDRIACRELYGKLFEYDPQFKIWLATNDLPSFPGGDQSISSRIRVIEFPDVLRSTHGSFVHRANTHRPKAANMLARRCLLCPNDCRKFHCKIFCLIRQSGFR